MKPVAHEHEALRGAQCLALSQGRCVNGVSGHRVSPVAAPHTSVSYPTTAEQPLTRNPAISQRYWLLGHPPSEPFVEGTSFFARGSMATAARNARANPLKHDSAIW